MEYVGYGMLCFGNQKYFKGVDQKIQLISLNENRPIFILTDNVDYFEKYNHLPNFHSISYTKSVKSYHDKVSLIKYIHRHARVGILLDADLHITDETIFDLLDDYHFMNGISYIDTLINHPAKFKTVADVDMNFEEWESYRNYVELICPEYKEFETIWEYFIAFNRRGIIDQSIYEWYERCQIAKDFSDLRYRKEISGAGEGISLSIASHITKTPIQRDNDLYEKLRGGLKPITRHTPSADIPFYLR